MFDLTGEIEAALWNLLSQPQMLAMTPASEHLVEQTVRNVLNAAVAAGYVRPDEVPPSIIGISIPTTRRMQIVTEPKTDHEARALWETLQATLPRHEWPDAIRSLCRRLPALFHADAPWLLQTGES